LTTWAEQALDSQYKTNPISNVDQHGLQTIPNTCPLLQDAIANLHNQRTQFLQQMVEE